MSDLTHNAPNITALFAPKNAVLVLADGAVFEGWGVGAAGETLGELCFNTAMTGYQEILTDPSYAGQVILFTFPHIGNVGCNAEDMESGAVAAKGLILRERITQASNHRAQENLQSWLTSRNVTGISGVDTRALTHHLRDNGVQNGVIAYRDSAFSEEEIKALQAKAAAASSLAGVELAEENSTKEAHQWHQPLWQESRDQALDLTIVALDFGVKQNILRHFATRVKRLHVLPARSTVEEILALNPDGVFLSNGPGDPTATGAYAIPVIQALLQKRIPLFGICLGHQMLALAAGCTTQKMKQGHHGANHPVQDLDTKIVEITSQNHGFVVADDGLPEHVRVTHRSLFDDTIQGIALKDAPAFSVQGHPEASPGPHDSHYLFDRFLEQVQRHRTACAA